MFKNEYQGGPFVEIFSAQGKNPGAKWKIFGSPSVIGKEFDKEVKGFVFVLEGSSQTNKMQLPKEMRQNLGLIQQFLVLQIYVPLGQDFSTELLITDLGNIKRRLYLSTVHKELSVTPLHAKIPLFMIKRKIWCNLCIDLVEFTSEIFKGAVYQSLDGIIVSANCKLRKIFTLKSKPLDTADEDVDGPTDSIPRTCQLNSDVPQITQLLNMNKLRLSDQKCGSRPFTSTGSVDHIMNRGSTTARNNKNQDVSHIAFGSKVLGPPPPSGRRFTTRASGEVTKSGTIRINRSCQNTTLEKGRDPVQDTVRSEQSLSPSDEAVIQGNKDNICHTTRTSLEKVADEWIFHNKESSQLDSGNRSLVAPETSCGFLTSALSEDQAQESKQTSEEEHEDVFTFSSKPRSAPHGKPLNLSSESCSFSVDLKEESSASWRGAQMEDDFYGSESSKEEYNWRNYQPGNMSASELQMLASMKRQQNEELENSEPSHGLSASQIDNCNISISTSSDDTTTWNSCRPAPINQGCHYQKEMTPLSHSNPRLLRRAPAPDEWHPPPSMPVPIYIDKDTHYEVNQILDSRLHKGRLQYLVDWKDFPSGDKEWVEAGNVKAPRLLRAFHRAFPDCPRPVDAG
ncbi:protein CFAP20DC isoform X6 [Paroedura picta]|uniref:protein CFAP20DC isoform X6 n=1 Tax=Paroedura picta TaxID=143630 RepID=UPI0040560DD0